MSRFAFALALALAAGPAMAATTGTPGAAPAAAEGGLPGGASSLSEAYDNWTVGCRMQDVQGKAAKFCSLTQVQTDKQSGKRVLEVDVQLSPTGPVAALILPFGLALPSGAQLQVDKAEPGPAQPFATCLPVGCVVRADLDPKLVAALKAGTEMKVKVQTASGQPAEFTVPLKGFAAGLDRMLALLK